MKSSGAAQAQDLSKLIKALRHRWSNSIVWKRCKSKAEDKERQMTCRSKTEAQEER